MTTTSGLDRLLVVLGAGLVAAAAAVLIFAGSSDSAGTVGVLSTATKSTNQIVISDFKFTPETVQVKAGTKVTFVNHDAAPHTATASGSKVFDTGTLKKGDKQTVTLTKTGTFAYFCEFHAFMKATIKVVG